MTGDPFDGTALSDALSAVLSDSVLSESLLMVVLGRAALARQLVVVTGARRRGHYTAEPALRNRAPP